VKGGRKTILRKMKKSLKLFAVTVVMATMGFQSNLSEAACNDGHESSGNQSWGSNFTVLLCDKQTTAICCTSKPIKKT
jgi:hypothetical protein